MARNRLLSMLLLYPISRLYGLGMAVRNRLFEQGILKQQEFKVPVVVVGNIAMGGTGKTPHVEYIIEALMGKYNIGVLSRGYKRATKGFVLATQQSRPEDIGDESYQIYRKFGPEITVAVCEKRVEGINRMLEINPKINLVLLDDAFQHRYVKPSVSIVLTEHNRPVFKDSLLPYGRLREPRGALNRADIVVVTKCPPEMKPMQYRIFEENLNLFPFQKLYFSRYNYGHLVPVFPDQAESTPSLDTLAPGTPLLVVTGVANPKPFARFLRRRKAKVKLKRFSDHHNFTAADMDEIEREFNALPGEDKFIVTTEKDAVRLFNNPYFPHALKAKVFYVPIKVGFIDRSNEVPFEQCVEKTIRDSRLFKS
ncbi:tetraacyldisaccharide 4'-kinase [uncultured Duncaniella sp.]|uniref:tetraacyldisaccharide 4'-kinase n=1 Tax=uncultured Duncaniella sp. TaxID=2768039 RepID=UPI0026F0F29B|nr:tetraacyldisaccharide 4'-kinase [uncultured Duncaniella sp.]